MAASPVLLVAAAAAAAAARNRGKLQGSRLLL